MKRQIKNQTGQSLISLVIMLTVVMSAIVVVSLRRVSQTKEEVANTRIQNLSTNMAKAGFDEAVAWFARQSNQPVQVNNATGLTFTDNSTYPDSAFKPKFSLTPTLSDTDEVGPSFYVTNYKYNDAQGNPIAAGIIRTIQLTDPRSTTIAAGTLWGRYVVKRQWVDNYPDVAGNTVTDSKAVHDISSQKNLTSGGTGVGIGATWSITAQGFVYTRPYALGAADETAFENNDTTQAPRKFYQGKRLLMSKSEMYGEISSMILKGLPYSSNSNDDNAYTALWMCDGSKLTLSGKAMVDKGTSSTASAICSSPTPSAPASPAKINGTRSSLAGPSDLSAIYSGTLQDLKNAAMSINSSGQDATLLFPDTSSSNSNASVLQRSQNFYFLDTPSGTGTVTFTSGASHQLAGCGFCYVNGDLTVQSGHNGWWAGILVVNGDVDISDPFQLSGMLIVLGANRTVKLSGSSSWAQIMRNKSTINAAKSLFGSYKISKLAVRTTF